MLELKGKDQLAYARAVEILAPTGISLEMAAIYIAEMHKILNGRNPIEAARGYAKLYPHESPSKRVAEVLEELVEAKEANKVSGAL